MLIRLLSSAVGTRVPAMTVCRREKKSLLVLLSHLRLQNVWPPCTGSGDVLSEDGKGLLSQLFQKTGNKAHRAIIFTGDLNITKKSALIGQYVQNVSLTINGAISLSLFGS